MIRIRALRQISLAALTFSAVLAAGGVGAAQPPSGRSTPPSGPWMREPFWQTRSRWTFGAQLGLAIENGIPRDLSHISLLVVQPDIAYTVHQFSSGREPLARFEIADEGIFGGSIHPGGRLLGNSVLLRLERRHHGRFIPFCDFGAGMLQTTLRKRAPELSGHLQFMPQAGLGLEYFFNPQRALVFEYRYMHMSNAGLIPPNHGFNGDMITLGFRWLPRPPGVQMSASPGGFLRILRLN